MDIFDQTSIFTEPEKEAYLAIKPALSITLHENGLDDSKLSFEQRKEYHSVLFEKSVIFRIYNKKSTYITVPTSALLIAGIQEHIGKSKIGYSKIPLPNLKEIGKFTEVLQAVLQAVIDSGPNEFDCCSRFEQCSDAKKCIHPDKAFSLGCGYRKILKSGCVFYGKNRNID